MPFPGTHATSVTAAAHPDEPARDAVGGSPGVAGGRRPEAGSAAGGDGRCDLSTQCGWCGGPMRPEHAHYRCTACGMRDSCCDGPY